MIRNKQEDPQRDSFGHREEMTSGVRLAWLPLFFRKLWRNAEIILEMDHDHFLPHISLFIVHILTLSYSTLHNPGIWYNDLK